MTESITVNGADLSTLVRNVESLAGLLKTPPRRTTNVTVPGRHGALLVPRKFYDPAEIVLPLWVIGANEATGAALSGDAAVTSFYQRVDELVALFSGATGTVTIVHTLPDGSARQAVAEVTEVMDFTRQLGSPLFGRVAIALTIPGAFWSDATSRLQTVRGWAGSTYGLPEFAGATAPMDDLSITFNGPIGTPKLTDARTGRWVRYDATIPAGQGVRIDCATWAVTGVGGLVVDHTKRSSSHSGRYFELGPTGALSVPLNGNPNFDTTAVGWTVTTAGGTFARSTDLAHTGAASGLLSAAGNSSESRVRAPMAPVVAGQQYSAAAWVYSPAGASTVGGDPRLSLYFYDAAGGFVQVVVSPSGAVPSGQWHPLSVTATAPANATQVAVAVTLPAVAGPAAQVYIDEVMVRRGVPPQVRIDHSSGSSVAANVTISGRRHFLTG